MVEPGDVERVLGRRVVAVRRHPSGAVGLRFDDGTRRIVRGATWLRVTRDDAAVGHGATPTGNAVHLVGRAGWTVCAIEARLTPREGPATCGRCRELSAADGE